MDFKTIWAFAKPILIKVAKYAITITLTSLGFSTLASCYTPIECQNLVVQPKVSISDSLTFNPLVSISADDSVVHSYDAESARIINDCTNFLKVISNKLISK